MIYAAGKQTAGALALLDSECYGPRSQGVQWWGRRLRDGNSAVLVAGEEVAGGFRLDGVMVLRRSRGVEGLELVRLGVRPDERRKGRARELVEAVGGERLQVELRETNGPGLVAARRLGFRAVGFTREGFGPGVGAVRLVREPGQ